MRREYPDAPIAAVGAVVLDAGRVLLIRRGQEPHKGSWSLPGGAVELGETLTQAVCREVLEETGLVIEPIRMVETVNIITRDSLGCVRYHYVVVDYLCGVRSGILCCATDALEAAWLNLSELSGAGLSASVLAVIAKASADGV